MMQGLRSYLRSVGGRLLIPLAITLTAVLAVHAILSFESAQEHFQRFVRADVDRHSDLFKRATHDGMLLNRLDEVQAIIERLAAGPQVAAIRFYDKEGAIVLSAARSEIGQRIALDSETCRSCHGAETIKDAAMLEQSALTRLPEGIQVLRQLTVIENEPECATAPCHFHPPSRRVLGVLDVEMSMAPIEMTMASAERHLVWTTLVLVLTVLVVTGVFIRRLVQRPVGVLHDATQRIAGGDLSTRIPVTGRHELARLGEAFNRMAGDLEHAHEELQDWSHKLEAKVVEKTEELRRAQRQVLHSEKMASLGKLSATVAHEINNPLSGVLAYARLVERELADQPLSPEVRAELGRYLSLIQKESARCGEIVKNLLLFARRRGAEMTRIDVNAIVERSLMLVRHHLEMSGVRLRTDPLIGDPQIVADAGQLQQGLVALLVNAAEAMSGSSQDGGELAVRVTGDADEIRIDVSDTGVGIPPEVLPHIFEPFFSTKDGTSGVGLGLAVVYGIVQRHGGTIDVESRAGEGSTFHVRMPRVPRAAPAGV